MWVKKDTISFLYSIVAGVALIGIAVFIYQINSNNDSLEFDTHQDVLGEANLLDAVTNVDANLAPDAIRVPILIYHSAHPSPPTEDAKIKKYNVQPATLDKELSYLKDHHFTVVSMAAFTDALTKGWSLPPKPVVITFDDGWGSQYNFAFPILKKYGDTATFFVFTDAIGTKKFLTWDQLKEMDGAGMTIAAHTRTHPFLTKIANADLLRDEIAGSKSIIEVRLGKSVDFFAYPFGQYNAAAIALVREAGFRAARGANYSAYNSPDDLWTLKGVYASDDYDGFVKGVGN